MTTSYDCPGLQVTAGSPLLRPHTNAAAHHGSLVHDKPRRCDGALTAEEEVPPVETVESVGAPSSPQQWST